MSIQSEIDRISQNVSDSLDAVAAKGATVPAGSTSDDLPSLIASIQTGGAVESVNGQTGVVVLDADDVGALPDSYQAPVQSVNGQTGAVSLDLGVTAIRADNQQGGGVTNNTGVVSLIGQGCLVYTIYPGRVEIQANKTTIGLGNVANVLQYSASNPPPYPVRSVNSKTGAVSLTASDVGALPSNTAIPSAAVDIGALPSILDSNYYGTTLPTAGTVGRIFFLKTQ